MAEGSFAKRRKLLSLTLLVGVGTSIFYTNCSNSGFTTTASLEDSLQSASTSASCNQAVRNFPLPTHWSNTVLDIVEGASDTLQINESDPVKTRRIYNYGFLPTVNAYVGTSFDLFRMDDNDFNNWAAELCRNNGFPIDLVKPGSYSDWVVAKKSVKSNKQSVQLLYALRKGTSLVNVFLPPEWKSYAAKGTYPILAGGSYDISSSMRGDTATLVAAQMKLWKEKKKPFIVIQWNGGGGRASITMNPKSRDDFNKIVQDLSENFGADAQRIVTVGGSRGGAAALAVASNPEKNPYRVVATLAGVPVTDIVEYTELMGSTVAMTLGMTEYSLGLMDIWKKNFSYPAANNGLTGMNRSQAYLHVVTGNSDANYVRNNLNLNSSRFLNALKAAGTRVHLEISSHDVFIPYVSQLKYAKALEKAGIPTELKVNYLAGHWISPEFNSVSSLMNVMENTIDRRYSAIFNTGTKTYFKNECGQGLKQISGPIMTFEVPRFTSPNIDGHWLVTGEPGAVIEFDGVYRETETSPVLGSFGTQTATLNSDGVFIYKYQLDPAVYEIKKVRMKKKDSNVWKDISLGCTSTSMNSGALWIEALPTEPSQDDTAARVADRIMQGYLGPGYVKGINGFPNVTYGIAE
ncbi:prolyl oligopeptidase family serine peptidase [Bdellovibrio sp. HCB117]|uniref:prolyl oligopeptidase family serine peptidase n=1 Tax=Bdellovibrio sp. HCB117 TaxID=3394359 RepID=UPI0039B53228